MADTHPIRNGIITTVAGGVILAVLGRLWPPASRLVAWIAHVLGTSVPIPVWLLLLLAAATVWFIASIREHFQQQGVGRVNAASNVSAAANILDPAQDISGLEKQVLARIAKGDGEAVPRDTVKRSLGATNIRLQAAVDRLVQAELVEELENLDDPDEVVVMLTSKGRQYAVRHGLA